MRIWYQSKPRREEVDAVRVRGAVEGSKSGVDVDGVGLDGYAGGDEMVVKALSGFKVVEGDEVDEGVIVEVVKLAGGAGRDAPCGYGSDEACEGNRRTAWSQSVRGACFQRIDCFVRCELLRKRTRSSDYSPSNGVYERVPSTRPVLVNPGKHVLCRQPTRRLLGRRRYIGGYHPPVPAPLAGILDANKRPWWEARMIGLRHAPGRATATAGILRAVDSSRRADS